jgi:hypothetical protein
MEIWLKRNEFQRMLKETVRSNLRLHPIICPHGLKKSHSRYLSPDFSLQPGKFPTEYFSNANYTLLSIRLCRLYVLHRITVVARSKARNVFARSNTGIAGSSPTQGMDICLRLIGVCVGSGLASG